MTEGDLAGLELEVALAVAATADEAAVAGLRDSTRRDSEDSAA